MFCNLNTESFSKKKKKEREKDLEPSCCFVYVYPAVEKAACGFSLRMVKGVGGGESQQLYRAVWRLLLLKKSLVPPPGPWVVSVEDWQLERVDRGDFSGLK